MTNFITLLAPAKINLSLVITGKQADGYHLLDSLVSFADWGDEVRVELVDLPEVTLEVSGEFAEQCGEIERNLAYRAAQLMREHFSAEYDCSWGCHIHIEKHIPVGAGLGGGSSDAAAVMKALNQLWNINAPIEQLAEIGLSLGADVPACLYAQPLRMRGIGEEIELFKAHTPLYVILLNPRKHLSTGRVYGALEIPETGAEQGNNIDELEVGGLLAYLANLQQHMEKAAASLMPDVPSLLSILSDTDGCELARICGSGATCMGLFSSQEKRDAAYENLSRQHPFLWIQSVQIGSRE